MCILINTICYQLHYLDCFALLLLIVLSSCNSHTETKGVISRIEINKTNYDTKFLYASEFISDIEYVPLETTTECLIGRRPNINISENYIFVSAEPNCLLFSRQGKFIRHIGNKGNGPGDFTSITDVKIDEESGMVYLFSSFEKLLVYRISSEYVKKLDLIELVKSNGLPYLGKVFHWKNDLFCSNIDLNSGKELYRFVVFTLDGDIVKFFPNYETFDDKRFHSDYIRVDIFLFNGQIIFKEGATDTLFRITDKLA